MRKMNVLVVVLSVVFASPLSADWVYQGTTSYVSPPDSDSAPDGSWWYAWNGQGAACGAPGSLLVSGWTQGNCGVALAPAAGTGLQEWRYIWSHANGQSTCIWEPGGSKAISFTIASTTYTGSGASNDPENVTVNQDWVDWWYPYPYDYNVGYEGYLAFTASLTPSYQGEPTGDMFTVSATVGGSAAAQASIQIGDPNYYYLRAGGEGAYSISGQAEITLYGDIR